MAEADDGRPDEQPDYLFLAWHLEQKLHDLINSEYSPEFELQKVLRSAVSKKAISCRSIDLDDKPYYVQLAVRLKEKLSDL